MWLVCLNTRDRWIFRTPAAWRCKRGDDRDEAEAQHQLEATPIPRGLISEIRMTPDPKAPDGQRIELIGELAGTLGPPSYH